MPAQPHRPVRGHHASSVAGEILEAGSVAGLVGGVAMVLFAMLYAAAVGIGVWTPVQAVAAIVFGTSHVVGAGAALVGLAVHLLTSLVMGIVFALVTPRDVSAAPAVALGAFAGISILVVMNLLVLPTYTWTGPTVNSPAQSPLMWGDVPGTMPVPVAFVAHVIYGIGLALAPGLRRRLKPS